MAWARTYDIDTPDGSVDSPAEADDRMKEIKSALQERLDVDHYFPLTGTEVSDNDATEHRKITIRTLTAVEVAALTATKAYIYRLVTDGELYFKDASGNTIKLTSGGKILSASLDMKDEDAMASDSATHAATQQSIKAYADAVAAAAAAAVVAVTDPAYAGGQSHTFIGGLIIKFGKVTTLGIQEHRTVTFGVAFPNACVAALASLSETPTSIDDSISVHTVSTTKIEIESRHTAAAAYWLAIGY